MKLPTAFVTKYTKLLGDEAPAFFASFDQPVTHGFRLNPLKPNMTAVAFSLNDPVIYTRCGYYGSVSGNTIEHNAGYVYSQEPSAMAVAALAAPKTGMKVLDLCAAPGGKSTQIGALLGDTGLLVSNEINHSRAKVLSSNIERMGIQNVIVTNNAPDELAKLWPHYFDMILVDAPCSGEGMFRKDPEAITYWHKDYPAECARRQKQILTSAMQMLAPHGQLIYSTCTFAPEEDEQNIAWLLANYPHLHVVPLQPVAGMVSGKPQWANGDERLAGTIRFFPHLSRGEGHFIAKLQNDDDEVTVPRFKPWHAPRLNPTQQKLWQTFQKQTLNVKLPASRLTVWQDQLLLLPAIMPIINGAHIMRLGLKLGTFRKKRFEPDYALSHALPATAFKVVIALNDDQYQQYCHGDILTLSQTDKQQWCVVTYQDKPFSLGKLVGNTLKNFYPKGLRH